MITSTVAAILVLGALASQSRSRATPAFLEEPDYFVVKEGENWSLRKPKLRILGQAEGGSWVIFEDRSRERVELRKSILPRLRLNHALVKFNPLTRERSPVVDWTGQSDAQEIDRDIQTLVHRFASAKARTLISSTPLYLARLNGASGHTAEEWNDHKQFIIYVDPFRATGRLHAASTLVHELSHVERYRQRGFHANRAAAVLPRADFILLGVVDELAGYEAESEFIQAFLSRSSNAVRQEAHQALPVPRLRWPQALIVLLGLDGPMKMPARMRDVRNQVVLDLDWSAGRYWDGHHQDRLDPALEAQIRRWYSESREWTKIDSERGDWLDAGARVK